MRVLNLYGHNTPISLGSIEEIEETVHTDLIDIKPYMKEAMYAVKHSLKPESGVYIKGSVIPFEVPPRRGSNKLIMQTHDEDMIGYVITAYVINAVEDEYFRKPDMEIYDINRYGDITPEMYDSLEAILRPLASLVLQKLLKHTARLIKICYRSNHILIRIGMDARAAAWILQQVDEMINYEEALDKGLIDYQEYENSK